MMTIERVHINKAPGVRVFRIFMPCRGQTGEYKTNVFPEDGYPVDSGSPKM